MVLRDQYEVEEMRYTMRLSYKFVNGIMLSNIYADTSYFNNHRLRTDIPKSIKFSPQYVSEYVNSLATFRFVVMNNLRLQENIRKKAEDLLVLMKKEYHLK